MLYYVEFESTVRFDRIRAGAATILAAAYRIAQRIQHNLLVTAGTDSHVAPSRHLQGDTLDFRVNDLPAPRMINLKNQFETELGLLFYVSLEAPAHTGDPELDPHLTINPAATAIHLHVQPTIGSVYPPPTPSVTAHV